MPIESLFSFSRAIATGEIIFKSLSNHGRARLEKIITAIEKKPESQSAQSVEPQEGSSSEPLTPGTSSELTRPQGSPESNPGSIE